MRSGERRKPLDTIGVSRAPRTPQVVDTLNLIVLGWILYASLMPFAFELHGGAMWDRLQEGLHQGWSGRLRQHVAVHGALGLLWTAGGPSRRAVAPAASVCLAIELFQVLIVGRHPRLGDWAVNTAAAASGAVIGRILVRHRLAGEALAACRRATSRHLRILGWAGLAAATAIAAAMNAVQGHEGVSFGDWDPRFPLAVGHEADGSQPWHGTLDGVALYPRAWDDAQMRRFAEGSEWSAGAVARRLAAPGVAYDLTPSHPSAPHGEGAPPADIDEELGVWRSCDLLRGRIVENPERRLETNAGWVSRAPMSEWTELARRSHAFTIQLDGHWPKATTPTAQTILAVGDRPGRRNLALIQDGTCLELHVRCVQAARMAGPRRWSGPVARWALPAPDLADAFRLGIVFERGQARLYSDGQRIGTADPLPRAFARQRIGGAGPSWLRAMLWFAPLGFALGRLARVLGLRRRLAFAAALPTAFALGPLATQLAESRMAATSAAVPLSPALWLGGVASALAVAWACTRTRT